ncbi:MAG: IS982 family transposase, partial [Thermotaleaceae bacterium]
MLEFSNKYSIKEIADLKDFITIIYILIDDIYQEITPTHIKEHRNIKDAILSDSEIITISIVGELLTIDSEKAWLGFCNKNLRDLFPRFCSRTRFNRTRRALHSVIDEIRKELTK